MSDVGAWLALFGLGAFHGINPGMGWLFAVALGLQEQKRGAVLRALPPIALGHALSVGTIVALVLLARANLTHNTLKICAATVLFGFGAYRLVRSRHPNWVGMRVNFRDLTLWSFLMASAHGAGLMLVPIFLGIPTRAPAIRVAQLGPGLNVEPFCSSSIAVFSSPTLLASSVGVHTLGHLLVAGLVALVVYEKLGLALLQKTWFNIDLVWMIALVTTGIVVFLV